MKSVFILFTLMAVSTVNAQYAVTVVGDPIAQINHTEDIAKWVESIQKLNTQIDQMRQYVQIAQTVKGYMGDPASVAGAVGLDLLGQDALGSSVGQLSHELNRSVSGLRALQNDGQGLFKPIELKTPSGFDLNFNESDYNRYSAVQQHGENVVGVVADSLRKIARLQQDKAQTLAQIKAAATQSEVQKLEAKLSAIDGEIAARNQQIATAQTQLVAQDIANHNQRDMEAQAATEAVNQELAVTLENYSQWQGKVSRSTQKFK